MSSNPATARVRRPVRKPARWNGSVPGRDEQRNLKRRAILAVAAKMFVENGYHETSLADIAEHLNVTKPTLYYYVSSKEEMLAQIAGIALAGSEKMFAESCERGADALDSLRLFMRAYVRAMTDDFGRCLLAARHLRWAPRTQHRLTAGFRRIDSFARELFERGERDGSMVRTDARMAAFVLYGAVNWIPHWYREDGALAPEEAGEAMFDVLARGLAKKRVRP